MAAVTSSPALTDPRVRWTPSTAGMAARLVVLALLGVAVLAIPHLLPGTLVNVYARAAVYGVVALSMNILIGYAGQVSLGHQAFVGVGAFTSAYLLSRLSLPWLVAVVGTIILGAIISLGLGAVALRVKGLYFALVTIAYGVFVQATIFGITELTGGGAGASAPRPAFATGDIPYAYVCVAALLVAWAFDWRLTSSRAGRAIEALRDDERVAASWGINVTGYKLLAFALAGGVAALAGALFASIEQIVSPITFGLPLALTFVLMTVVGGLRSRPGVVIGGIVFAILPTLLESAHAAWGEGAEVCTTAPPRLLQLGLGLALIGGVAERVVHAVKRDGWTGRTMASTAVAGLFGIWVFWTFALAGFTGGYCVWKTIDALWEPLIGALLLILTLTQFPGGIAQQFAPVFSWLSFRPFSSGHGAGSPAASGGSDARP
jgi:branched-chain amino acid transport system permease protein